MGKEDQRLGKKGEFRIFGELLTRDLTVYYPLFDVEGIDCIVRNRYGEHIDIQIKTRRNTKLWDVIELKPRPNFFIIVYVTEPNDEFWVLPSEEFVKFSKINVHNGKRIFRLTINNNNEEKLLKYHGDYSFKNIINFDGTLEKSDKPKNMQLTKVRINRVHYKQGDFYPIIIQILKKANRPLRRQEIRELIKEQLYTNFSEADKEKLNGGGERWEKTLMWAISHLAMDKVIVSKIKNKWELKG